MEKYQKLETGSQKNKMVSTLQVMFSLQWETSGIKRNGIQHSNSLVIFRPDDIVYIIHMLLILSFVKKERVAQDYSEKR
jgi:hypothetical protein